MPAPGRVLRTPDSSFNDLQDYPFAPSYQTVRDVELGPLRVHCIAEGPRNGAPVVLLHGQPSWSYLYRKVVPTLVNAGHRVLAPDLIGYGRSDKPAKLTDYSYARHVEWITAWFNALDLTGVTLVVHDWGGMIGLRIAAAMPERFSRLAILNTSLPDGTDTFPPAYFEKYVAFRDFLLATPKLSPSRFISAQVKTPLTAAVMAGYDAPYPTNELTSGVRVMTSLIPFKPSDPGAAENARARLALSAWRKPVMLAFSEDSDRVHPGQHALFRSIFQKAPICRDEVVLGARHFLQEDRGPELATSINRFIAET